MRPKFALPAFLAADQIDDRGATSLPPAHTLAVMRGIDQSSARALNPKNRRVQVIAQRETIAAHCDRNDAQPAHAGRLAVEITGNCT
jgi:hypothetical protein